METVVQSADVSKQSTKCQDKAWSRGHRSTCKAWSPIRKSAAALSGNPKAWADLTGFLEYHQDSFVNATLNAYLSQIPEEMFPDVAADNYTTFSLWYRNDPDLPVGKKFELRNSAYSSSVYPQEPPVVLKSAAEGYDAAVELGKRQFGNSYQGTGTYVLHIRFGAEDRTPPWPDHTLLSVQALFHRGQAGGCRCGLPRSVSTIKRERGRGQEDSVLLRCGSRVVPVLLRWLAPRST